MAILNVIKYGDPILRKKCKPVEKISKDEKKLFEDMVDTLRSEKGVGLAAPQVGVSRQLIVVSIGKEIIKLANPNILKKKGVSKLEEGCLSLPGIQVTVKRAKEIVLAGINEENKKVNIRASELAAHIFQHEIDHLYGKLIIDKMGLVDKIKIKRKLKKNGQK